MNSQVVVVFEEFAVRYALMTHGEWAERQQAERQRHELEQKNGGVKKAMPLCPACFSNERVTYGNCVPSHDWFCYRCLKFFQ